MDQHPGFLTIGFICLGLMGYALWPSSAPAHSGTPVNIYLGSPDSGAGPDSEMSFEDEPPQNEEERHDSALPDESATFAI